MTTPPNAELSEAFRTAFRNHPAGISLITAQTEDGPVGLTASSVASVGLDPVSLVFSVTRATGSAGGILSADSFVVHLIDSRHVAIAQQFAVSGGERFTHEQGWTTLPTGEPFLREARAALRCRPLQITPVGASSVVIAEILETLDTAENEDQPAAAPLIYHDRLFRTLGDAL